MTSDEERGRLLLNLRDVDRLAEIPDELAEYIAGLEPEGLERIGVLRSLMLLQVRKDAEIE